MSVEDIRPGGGEPRGDERPARGVTIDDLERASKRLAERGLTRVRRDLPARSLSEELIARSKSAVAARASEAAVTIQREDLGTGESECPWCQSPIRNQGDPYGPAHVCPSCGLAQHRSHWDAGGGCARPGCPNNPRV